MAVFHYVSVDSSGRSKKGVLEGDSPVQIRQHLREMGLTPIEIKPAGEKKFLSKGVSFFSRKESVSASALSLLTYQFGTLLSAGLPVEGALLNMAEQMEKTPLKTVLLNVRARVLEGHSLAYGMDEYPHIFPKLYRATIAAGEKSGQLDNIINRLSIYLESQSTIKQKVQQALIYPILLTIVSISIVIFLLTYAMPRIVSVFQETGQALPDLTRMLLAFSSGLRSYGLYILFLIIIIVIGFRHMLKRRHFQYSVHEFLLRVPILNNTLKIVNAARFARTFGILFAAGVPVIEAMHAANSIITLLPMHDAVEKGIISVGEGMSIHKALQQTGYFSLLTTQLIASGETSGKLEVMLEKTAAYQEQNVVRWISTALSLFEPFMILLMGVIVLFIVLAILLPIFELNQFMR